MTAIALQLQHKPLFSQAEQGNERIHVPHAVRQVFKILYCVANTKHLQ